MKWYKFLIYFQFFAEAVLNVLLVVSNWLNADVGLIEKIVITVAGLGSAVLAIITRFKMAAFDFETQTWFSRYWWFNQISNAVKTVLPYIKILLVPTTLFALGGYIAGTIVLGYFTYYRWNMKYLEKRADLFTAVHI